LAWVLCCGAVIAGVTDLIIVPIPLVGVGVLRAVVTGITHSISILIISSTISVLGAGVTEITLTIPILILLVWVCVLRAVVTGISTPVSIAVSLIWIGIIRAAIAEISMSISISIGLIWIGYIGAVVLIITEIIPICIQADPTHRALQNKEAVGLSSELVPGVAIQELTGVSLDAHQLVGVVKVPTSRLSGVIIVARPLVPPERNTAHRRGVVVDSTIAPSGGRPSGQGP